MTQMTNQKKTELIDFFDLVWTKNPQFFENFLKMEAIFSKTALKIVLWRPPLGTKIPKRVQLFRQKFQEGSMSGENKAILSCRCRDFIVAHPRPKIS